MSISKNAVTNNGVSKNVATDAAAVPVAEHDVADLIGSTIAAAITDRSLKPGTWLPEDSIGEHFGVSRTVVRSALNRLQREKLIEFRKNRGAFVVKPGVDEARDLLDARRVIEEAIVSRVIDKATDAQFAHLERCIEREEQAHHHVARERTVQLSGEFHIELGKLAGNRVLEDFIELLVRRTALVISLYGSPTDDSCLAPDHRRLVGALKARDKAAARRIMAQHLNVIRDSLRLTEDASGEEGSLRDILTRHTAPRPGAGAARTRC
jgi:DNA-binding GntR family transcriptional regulator